MQMGSFECVKVFSFALAIKLSKAKIPPPHSQNQDNLAVFINMLLTLIVIKMDLFRFNDPIHTK